MIWFVVLYLNWLRCTLYHKKKTIGKCVMGSCRNWNLQWRYRHSMQIYRGWWCLDIPCVNIVSESHSFPRLFCPLNNIVFYKILIRMITHGQHYTKWTQYIPLQILSTFWTIAIWAEIYYIRPILYIKLAYYVYRGMIYRSEKYNTSGTITA